MDIPGGFNLWDTLITIATIWFPQVVTVASIITAATPTKKDNMVLNGLLNIIRLLGLNVAKAKPAA